MRILKVAACVALFVFGALLSRMVREQPVIHEQDEAYFVGCVDGLMTAAVLSGVPTAMDAHKDNVVRICNEAYTRRYNDSSYTWVTGP